MQAGASIQRSAAVWLLSVLLVSCGATVTSAAPPDFQRDVRPILSEHCFECHGPDAEARQADLRLDVAESALADRGGYAALVPGSLEESELWRRITSADELERMPPPEANKPLEPEQIEILRQWILDGAPWEVHWAYVRPHRHPVPQVQNADWPRNWIDHFILAALERRGIQPAQDADRVTLARRLSFDLTGLPPSTTVIERLRSDERPDAVARLVDDLLAQPAFGERMAVYWLDLVRYADTVGYHGDQDHNISPYRDYVIDALNRNIPFDRFTVEQLAGDLLPDAGPDQRIASGYNRLLQTSHEGGVQPKEYLSIYAADRVRNISAVWLGATLGCAQCHDHKFDPFTTKDFYSMVAFFADLDEAQHFTKGRDAVPTARPPEIPLLTRVERSQIEQIDRLLAKLASSDEGQLDPAEARRREAEAARLRALRNQIEKSARVTMISVSIAPRTIRILPRGNWLDDSGPVVESAVPEFLGNIDRGGQRATRLDLARWLTDPENGVGLLTARVMANRLWYLTFGEGLARDLEDFGNQGEAPTHPELLDRLAWELVESGWDIKQLLRLLVTSRTYALSSTPTPEQLQEDPENRLWARQSRFRLPAEMIRDAALAVSGLLQRPLGGASAKPYQPEGYYRHLNFPQRTYKAHFDWRQWRRGVYVHWQRQYLHPMLKAFDAPSREECTAQRPRSNTPLAALVLLNDPTFLEASRELAIRTLRRSSADPDVLEPGAQHVTAAVLAEAGSEESPSAEEHDRSLGSSSSGTVEGAANVPGRAELASNQRPSVELEHADGAAAEPSDAARLAWAFSHVTSRRPDRTELAELQRLLDTNRQVYAERPQDAAALLEVGLAPVPEDMEPAELASWTMVMRAILNLGEANTRY